MHKQIELSERVFFDLIKDKKLFFIFDYDGTLAPITSDPVTSLLTEQNKKILNELSNHAKVAILTGRAMPNLKQVLGTGLSSEILLMGTHGAEIGVEQTERPHGQHLDAIRDRFVSEAHLEIEEKSLAIAIHYKLHPEPSAIRSKLEAEAQRFEDIFRIQEGYKVYEFLPKDINKGMGINYLEKEYPDHLFLFFGDDLTDNFAFHEINELGSISVQMGERLKERVANYQLKEIDDLYTLLQKYIELKSQSSQ